ncbi:MAG: short-chain fatty acyl-CoA regulator family protein [Hyphomicrobiales bacterium]
MSDSALESAAEHRLHENLVEIAHLPALQPAKVEANRTNELVARFPGWAKGISLLTEAEQEASRHAQILSERLSNDPYLSETVHQMLTRIAAVRSATDILNEHDDLSPERRQRFTSISAEESRNLSEIAEALAKYLERTNNNEGTLTPVDEVEALFEARQGFFEELEKLASDADMAPRDQRPRSRVERARELASELFMGTINHIVSGASEIQTESARKRASRLLYDYAVGAILMPAKQFSLQAAELRYDIEMLADTFSVEAEIVCHRLTALRFGKHVPRFGYVRANAAGTIMEMINLEGLRLPRYAAACPLWALYRAQQSPETFIRQRAVFPSGARFVFIARARHIGPGGFGKPRNCVTDMVALSELDAKFTVYDPDPSALLEEVGSSCRLCPRVNCIHRVEDPLMS